MHYQLTIRAEGDSEATIVETFDSYQRVAEYLCSYIADEHNENPGCSTDREFWHANALACGGIATGGDIHFYFQGEVFDVRIEYATVDEMLAVFAECEAVATKQDPEGPRESDILDTVDNMRVVLPLYATDKARKWHMVVDTQYTDATGYGTYMREHCVHVGPGMRVTIPCAQGIVTFVPVYED